MGPSQNDNTNNIKRNTLNIVFQSSKRERGIKQIDLKSQILFKKSLLCEEKK